MADVIHHLIILFEMFVHVKHCNNLILNIITFQYAILLNIKLCRQPYIHFLCRIEIMNKKKLKCFHRYIIFMKSYTS